LNSSTVHGGGKRRRHQAAEPCQCCTHRIVKIGVGEAALQLQPRNNPLNETPRFSNGTRSEAAQTARGCESVKATMQPWSCRRDGCQLLSPCAF